MSIVLRKYYLVACVALCLSFVGCGGDGKLAVEGTVTWNGKPLENGFVELTPLDGAGSIVGADVVDGKFTLRTAPGEKRVSVTGKRIIGATKPTERIPNPEPIYLQFIPAEFNANSKLKTTVAATDPKVTLDLKGTEATAPGSSEADRQRQAAQGGKL
ncbi:MAG: hypothetical protein QM811_21310 [Pirellulales bacterium]